MLAAAFLAACSSDDGDSADSDTEAPTTTAPPAPDPVADLDLSLTFASLELVAIATYEGVLDALTTVELGCETASLATNRTSPDAGSIRHHSVCL